MLACEDEFYLLQVAIPEVGVVAIPVVEAQAFLRVTQGSKANSDDTTRRWRENELGVVLKTLVCKNVRIRETRDYNVQRLSQVVYCVLTS